MSGTGNEKNVNPPQVQQNPGEGIRNIKTTNVFRVLNFELYARPNKTTMVLGAVSISICLGYLAYWNYTVDRSKYYTATKEDGSLVLHPKTSRWES